MDDYEIEDCPCPHCGNEHLHVKSCDVIGCEDGYIDEYLEDPINFAPGDSERECMDCHGTGWLRWCPACGKDVILDETVTHHFRPCPFCGFAQIEESENFGGFYCGDCGYGWTYEGCDNEVQRAEVRARWNTRPGEDALRAENERLLGIIRSAHETFRTGGEGDDDVISVLMAKVLEEDLRR